MCHSWFACDVRNCFIFSTETPREKAESLPNILSLQPGAPPPNSSPPQPPTTPTKNPPQLTSDNPTSFSRSSPKADNHYARPVQRQLREATKSSPAIGGQYQDIRVSRLDYVQMYDVAINAKRTNMETKDDPDSNLKSNYVNLPIISTIM